MIKNYISQDGLEVDCILADLYGKSPWLSGIYLDLAKGSKSIISIFYCVFVVACLLIGIVCLIMTAVLSTKHAEIMSDSVRLICILTILISSFHRFFCKRRNFAWIHKQLNYQLYYIGLEAEIQLLILESHSRKKRMIRSWTLFTTLCGLFLVAHPPGLEREIGIERPSIPLINAALPLALWTPYSSTEGIHYVLWVVYEVYFTALSGCLAIFIFSAYISMLESISLQLRILKLSFKKIRERASILSKSKGMDNEKAYTFCVRQNVDHYVKVLKWFPVVSNLCSAPAFTAILSGSMMLACEGLSIIESEGRIIPVGKSLMFASGEIFAMFGACWFGEMISQLSKDLREEIYMTNWDEHSLPVMKSFLIILEANKKPLTIFAGGLIPISLETFANIMNASFSYFNLLRTLRS